MRLELIDLPDVVRGARPGLERHLIEHPLRQRRHTGAPAVHCLAGNRPEDRFAIRPTGRRRRRRPLLCTAATATLIVTTTTATTRSAALTLSLSLSLRGRGLPLPLRSGLLPGNVHRRHRDC